VRGGAGATAILPRNLEFGGATRKQSSAKPYRHRVECAHRPCIGGFSRTDSGCTSPLLKFGHEGPLSGALPSVTAPVSDKSIAVLPFTDMSEKRDQEYFSDGMAEENH